MQMETGRDEGKTLQVLILIWANAKEDYYDVWKYNVSLHRIANYLHRYTMTSGDLYFDHL